MNLQSCKGCGIVFNVKNVELIDQEVPDNPEDTEKDEDGDLITKEYHYNPNLKWGYDYEPLDTWQCPVCKTFNGIGEEK